MTKKELIHSLYLLKAICAFMVVGIHTPLGGSLHDALRPIFDVAVPLFFMITGYFLGLSVKEDKEKISSDLLSIKLRKTFKSISYICLILFAIYTIAGILVPDSTHLMERIKYNIYHLRMGFPASGMHLWYMSALWGGVFLLLLSSANRKLFTAVTFIAILLELVGVYYLPKANIPVSFVWLSTVLFHGLSNISIGYLWAKFCIADKLSNYKFMTYLIALIGLTGIYLFPKSSLNLLGVDLLVVALFTMAIHHPDLGRGHILTTIGQKYSQGIYYWHIPIVYLIASPEKRIEGWTNELLVLVCIALSLLLSFLVANIQERLHVPKAYQI